MSKLFIQELSELWLGSSTQFTLFYRIKNSFFENFFVADVDKDVVCRLHFSSSFVCHRTWMSFLCVCLMGLYCFAVYGLVSSLCFEYKLTSFSLSPFDFLSRCSFKALETFFSLVSRTFIASFALTVNRIPSFKTLLYFFARWNLFTFTNCLVKFFQLRIFLRSSDSSSWERFKWMEKGLFLNQIFHLLKALEKHEIQLNGFGNVNISAAVKMKDTNGPEKQINFQTRSFDLYQDSECWDIQLVKNRWDWRRKWSVFIKRL